MDPVALADWILRGSNSIHVVVGPLVWQPSDGTSSRHWYFTIATSQEGRGFRCDQINVDEKSREQDQAAVIAAICRRGALMVHWMDDELATASLCEILWPGERITRLRKVIENERAVTQPSKTDGCGDGCGPQKPLKTDGCGPPPATAAQP